MNNMKRRDIIKKLKNFDVENQQIEAIEDISERYKDKSEEDIFVEIIQLNAKMEEELSFEEYEEIFDKLDGIRHLLSEEQNEKLDKLLDALGK